MQTLSTTRPTMQIFIPRGIWGWLPLNSKNYPQIIPNDPITMPQLSKNNPKMIPASSQHHPKIIQNLSQIVPNIIPKWSQPIPKPSKKTYTQNINNIIDSSIGIVLSRYTLDLLMDLAFHRDSMFMCGGIWSSIAGGRVMIASGQHPTSSFCNRKLPPEIAQKKAVSSRESGATGRRSSTAIHGKQSSRFLLCKTRL